MWTSRSVVCITAGYEYSPGLSSNTSAAFQSLPSLDTATLSGLRPFSVWLYTSRPRPSLSITASIPAFGLGSEVAFIVLHVFPPSPDQLSVIFPCWLRHRIWMPPERYARIVG